MLVNMILSFNDVDGGEMDIDNCAASRCIRRYLKPEYTVSTGFETYSIHKKGGANDIHWGKLPKLVDTDIVKPFLSGREVVIGTQFELDVPEEFVNVT